MSEELIFGLGYCKRCGLIKQLAMVAIPGLHEDETGSLDGGELSLDPLERTGYCEPCAIAIIEAGEIGQGRPS